MESRFDNLLEKLNTKAFTMLSALILIVSGIQMCLCGLNETGSINLKTTFFEGEIETGSLGLMAMFLGVVIILALNFKSPPCKDQEVKIIINGNQVTGKGLSYRKLKELITIAAEDSNKTNSHNKKIQPTTDRGG